MTCSQACFFLGTDIVRLKANAEHFAALEGDAALLLADIIGKLLLDVILHRRILLISRTKLPQRLVDGHLPAFAADGIVAGWVGT